MKAELLHTKRSANRLLLLVCILFPVCNLLPSMLLQTQDTLIALLLLTLVAECGVLIVPTLLFMRRNGGMAAFGLVRTRRPSILIWAFLMGIGAFCLATGINSLMQALWVTLDVNTLDTALVINQGGGWRFVASLVCIVIVPAIAEETFFRGALLHAWLPQNRTHAILQTALLFALFHFNPMSFPAYILLGLLMGTMTVLSGSCYPAMILHGMNNLIALLLTYAIGDDTAAMAEEVMTASHFVTAGVLYSIIGLILLFFFYKGFKRAVAIREAARKLLHGGAHAAQSVFFNESGQEAAQKYEAATETPEQETDDTSAEGQAALCHDNATLSGETEQPAYGGGLPDTTRVPAKKQVLGTGKIALLLSYGLLILFNALILVSAAMGWM